MTDDALKNYNRQFFSDELEYNPELGFNPYWWVNRVVENSYKSLSEKDRKNMLSSYCRYRELLEKLEGAGA